MKKNSALCLIALVLTAILTVPGFCREMYVGDITELNLRSGKGVTYPVITTLTAGDAVLVTSTAGDWTKIRTADGTEGWVASRYLTGEKPVDIRLEDLKIHQETLQEKLEMATLENQRLTEENISLTTQLNEKILALTNTQKALDALKADSGEYLALKEKYEQASKTMKELKEKNRLLEKRGDQQYASMAIKWALTGAGILLAGYFLGARNRRKRSSLL